MKVLSVGFMFGALLTLALAASLQELEAETNINAEVMSTSCYDSMGNAYKPGETYTEDGNTCTCTSAGQPECRAVNAQRFCRVNTCQLQAVTGPCRALFRRWYYDVAKRRCVRFIYGGCQGNANNFKTRRSCMRQCKQSRRG